MTPIAPIQSEAEFLKSRIGRFREVEGKIKEQVRRVIVGQEEVLEQVMIALFVGGHCLITGLPGTAKTLLVRTMAQTLGLLFKRIQFTPDLMPSDITGTDIIEEDHATGRRSWTFVEGPIFANILLADEINRTPPKTQSALLEAMQEHKVTASGKVFALPKPFFVLATQNPIEQEGTYQLPEAQLDRFMFFIHVQYPSVEEERQIARATTGAATPALDKLISGEQVLAFQELIQRVPVPDHIYDTAVELVRMTRPADESAPAWVKKWVSWGGGPRAVQYLIRGAKAHAVLNGSYLVRMEDIEAVALPVLTHRILTNFQAQTEGMTSPKIVERLLAELRGKDGGAKK